MKSSEPYEVFSSATGSPSVSVLIAITTLLCRSLGVISAATSLCLILRYRSLRTLANMWTVHSTTVVLLLAGDTLAMEIYALF